MDFLNNSQAISFLHKYLPSFQNMDIEPSSEEIIRVAGITVAMLNLTFKNPFPVGQDPMFDVVIKVCTSSLKESLDKGNYTIDSHEELKESFNERYSNFVTEQLMKLDYWNQRMIEHVVITKTLGPKPAFNCIQTALNIEPLNKDAFAILIINYAYLLLKFSMLRTVNPLCVNDILKVLGQESQYLHFSDGWNYALNELSN